MVLNGFDECVSVTRCTMNTIGVWPDTKSSNLWYSRINFFISLFLILFFIILPQTRMLFYAEGDFNVILDILTTADIIITIACFKLIGILYNGNDLGYLLTEMASDWKITKKEKQKVMWRNAKLSRMILSIYAILTYGTVIMYAIYMLIVLNTLKQENYHANISVDKPLFFNSKFFFDTQKSPTFEIIWICQFLATVVSCSAFTSFDGFFVLSILHLCAQLFNLQESLRTLAEKTNEQNFVQSLNVIVNRHIHLQQLTYYIEDNFNQIFLVQMIFYSITICLQGYQIVVILGMEMSNNSIAALAFAIIFAVANILSLFLYCFVAEKLRTESTNIFFIAYDIHWYELKTTESKMLLNIMQATMHPFTLTAGKFVELSFKYFAKILKVSAGYLSMLLAIKSNQESTN